MDTGQSVRQQINTPFSHITGPISFPNQKGFAEGRSWLHLSSSDIFMKLKNASEMPFSGGAKSAPSSNREDDHSTMLEQNN